MKLLKNPAIYVVVAYCLLFLATLLTFGSTTTKSIIDYIVLSISLLFCYKWSSTAWEAFKFGGIEKKFRLSLGLFLLAAGLAAQRVWIILTNQTDWVKWLDKDTMSAFIASWWIGAIVLCLSIESPEDSFAPNLKWYYTYILIAFGIVIGFFLYPMVISA